MSSESLPEVGWGSSDGSCVCPDPSHPEVSASTGDQVSGQDPQGRPEETWRLGASCGCVAGAGISFSCPHLDSSWCLEQRGQVWVSFLPPGICLAALTVEALPAASQTDRQTDRWTFQGHSLVPINPEHGFWPWTHLGDSHPPSMLSSLPGAQLQVSDVKWEAQIYSLYFNTQVLSIFPSFSLLIWAYQKVIFSLMSLSKALQYKQSMPGWTDGHRSFARNHQSPVGNHFGRAAAPTRAKELVDLNLSLDSTGYVT